MTANWAEFFEIFSPKWEVGSLRLDWRRCRVINFQIFLTRMRALEKASYYSRYSSSTNNDPLYTSWLRNHTNARFLACVIWYEYTLCYRSDLLLFCTHASNIVIYINSTIYSYLGTFSQSLLLWDLYINFVSMVYWNYFHTMLSVTTSFHAFIYCYVVSYVLCSMYVIY